MTWARRQPGSEIMARPARRQELAARRWWPVLVPLAVLAIGVSLLLPAGRHQWALSLFRQPMRYTALSFNKAWALPTTAVINEPIAISFTIGNQEGRAMDYRYGIIESAGGISHTLGESTRIVAAGATWIVSTVIRPTCATSPCRVEVWLPGHPETIDFLVTLRAGRKKHG